MTVNKKFLQKLTSVILSTILILSCIPLSAAATSRERFITRVADPANADSWKEFFLPNDGTLSTENAGGIWTNKSVYTDASDLGSNVSMDGTDSMLVALSAIASNMTVTGMSSVSTDTVLVLDVSGSMGAGYNNVASELVDAANTSITTLLTGTNNRVGVVLYSDSATTVLPLGRYTTTDEHGRFLSINNNNDRISLDDNVRKEGGGLPYSGNNRPRRDVEGGTYIQSGIIRGMELFTASGNTDLQNRKPIMVVMTDGAPTYASSDFRTLNSRNMGSGSSTSTAIGFVTQLTAAYAKQQIEEHYNTNSLFYTLGLAIGSNRNMNATQIAYEKAVATSVLNPVENSTAIAKLWSDYNNETGNSFSLGDGYSVRKVDGLSSTYVNSYFNSDDYTDSSNGTLADALKKAFAAIVADIELQSIYYPTLVQGDEDLSGYITFNDKIGKYMKLTDIKGIRIGNTLFSGADLSSNFVAGGGLLGTYDNPTALGDEMVAAVQQRLGLATAEQARTLIGLAYANGQLSYTDRNNFSNYIGWYANAQGQYLGFWHEGITTMPDPADSSLTDATRPAYIIKSYGYLGEANAHVASDMMYATVQVREDIKTGEETVVFAIPASLIPTITYAVTLNEEGEIENLENKGATTPIQLVYEVALDSKINEYNVKDMVSAEYLSANTNADGSVNFYTNQYEVDNSTGYGKVNAFSYFRPARENDRYYYQDDTEVYSDAAGTKYIGTAKPTGTVYHGYTVYKKDSASSYTTETVYHALTSDARDAAVKKDDNSWYIPAGTVRRDYNGFVVPKATNTTGTLTFSEAPFTDIYGHHVDETDHSFVFGSTLGNNGKLTLNTETGIKLSKRLMDGTPTTDKAFEFVLTNTTNSDDSTNYPAYKIFADGRSAETFVQFNDGTASVSLKAGESIYIGGMIAEDVINVKETKDSEYILSLINSDNVEEVNLTVAANSFQNAEFVNSLRGKGNLVVSKEIEHPFGSEYTLPNKEFNIAVTLELNGAPLAGQSFNNGAVTTNADGKVVVGDNEYITLAHGEQFEIYDIPAGTKATVTETLDPVDHKGFSASYFDNGVAGDGKVEMAADTTASVIVVNTYAPDSTQPNIIELKGEKTLTGRIPDEWTDNDVYEFVLQRNDNGIWAQIGAAQTVNKNNKSFDFTTVIQAEEYSNVGSYYYRVVELEPEVGAVEGVAYDKTVHAFAVDVTDNDMDGSIEVTSVRGFRENNPVITGNATDGFKISTQFTNAYSATGNTNVAVEIHKSVTNDSGSTLPKLSGFTFGLYKAGESTPTYVSEQTTGTGTTRLIIDNITEIGEHSFILKEIAPNPIPKGWSYSSEEINVTIKVNDNGLGVKSAVIYKTENGESGATNQMNAAFTNIYDPYDTILPIEFVSKKLNNKALEGNDFTFAVKSYDPATGAEATVLVGTNDKTGKVIFDDVLRFNKVGNYFYNVVETSLDENGITTDKNVYRVSVAVSDVDGVLSAKYDVVNDEDDFIEFVNTYTAQPKDYAIEGTKILKSLSGTTERSLVNDEFIFVMTELDVNGQETDISYTAKNAENGDIIFPTITYTKAGTYAYSVKEKITEGIYDIEFDSSLFTATVVIIDNGLGELVLGPVSYTKNGQDAPDGIVFENTYKSIPANIEILGDKLLEGRDLNADEFEFALFESDPSFAEGNPLGTVSNAADGSFKFERSFDKIGDYYFIIKEVVGNVGGVSYDPNVYGVYVNVTDNLKGQLIAETLITDSNGIPQEAAVFVNQYAASGSTTVPLNGTKTLKNGELKDNEFEFKLYSADENFNASENVVATVKNVNSKFKFELNFTADQIGETYYYVAKEVNGGETIDEVKYDDTVYNITVTVEDDLEGGVKASYTVQKGEKYVDSIDFVNEYNEVVEPPQPPTQPSNPPTGDSSPTSPKTGQQINIGELFALLFISGGLFTASIRKLKKAK
ncbi:MAG: FctA domain-containing protein [Clostridia bacterium]|nr:FctA domain-containing protein [Clostridia bacterium]